MQMNRVTSKNVHQDVSEIKHAELSSSVMMSGRGQLARGVLSPREYEKIPVQQPSITELLSMPATDDIVFEPSKANTLYQPAVF